MLGATDATFLGTEPIRRAADASRIVHDITTATGAQVHVLSHEEEAFLTIIGVTGGRPVTQQTLVIDVEACKGCDLCIDACPPRVLVMTTHERNERGYRFPQLLPGCTACQAASNAASVSCTAIPRHCRFGAALKLSEQRLLPRDFESFQVIQAIRNQAKQDVHIERVRQEGNGGRTSFGTSLTNSNPKSSNPPSSSSGTVTFVQLSCKSLPS